MEDAVIFIILIRWPYPDTLFMKLFNLVKKAECA
jgi:hypothetical protein